jgi:hypothetical protein
VTAVSQSGYPVIIDRADPRILRNPTVPGTDVQILGGVLAGPVAVVLLYYAARFNAEVEHLELGPEPGDDWGGTPKQITDGTGWSNHASYTAIDLNATEHPQHVRGTFTARQYAAMRRIAQELAAAAGRTILRLGIDWTGTSVDEMHVEIAPGLHGTGYVERAARLIARGNLPNTPPELLEGAEDMALSDDDVEKVAAATVDKLMKHDMGEIKDAANATPENPDGTTSYTFLAWARRLVRLTGLTQAKVRSSGQ